MRVRMVSPDYRYLTGIDPHGRALLSIKRERAKIVCRRYARKLIVAYQLRDYVLVPIQEG